MNQNHEYQGLPFMQVYLEVINGYHLCFVHEIRF